MRKENRLVESARKAIAGLANSFPILIMIILLVSISSEFVDARALSNYIGDNQIIGPFVGAIAGSIFAGNPVTSYVIAGELKNRGVGITAITAFLICWVTVGFVQFPAEAVIMGKRFAIARNVTAFIFSLLIAFAVLILVGKI